MKKAVLAVLALGLFAAFAAAQSNEIIDDLLGQETARLDTTAYMILTAGEKIDENISVQEAYLFLAETGWIDRSLASDAPVTGEQFSNLVMRALDMSGGIMYRLFPGPRYAYREMIFQSILDSSVRRRDTLSGDEIMRYLARAMNLREAQ